MNSASSADAQKSRARLETSDAPDEIESSLRHAIAALLVHGTDQGARESSCDFTELAARLEELLDVYVTELRPRMRAAAGTHPAQPATDKQGGRTG